MPAFTAPDASASVLEVERPSLTERNPDKAPDEVPVPDLLGNNRAGPVQADRGGCGRLARELFGLEGRSASAVASPSGRGLGV